jgi:hypothetical protein
VKEADEIFRFIAAIMQSLRSPAFSIRLVT